MTFRPKCFTNKADAEACARRYNSHGRVAEVVENEDGVHFIVAPTR